MYTLIDGESLDEAQSKQLRNAEHNLSTPNKAWGANKLDKAFPKLASHNLSGEFTAYCNEEPKILAQIYNVSFPNMKSLNVWGNFITSVEGICRISMPSLEALWIWTNDIACFKSLRKIHFPNLRILDAKQNRASEASEWCQIMAKGLNRIDLHPGVDELVVEEIRFIFKMEMVKPGNIYANRDRLPKRARSVMGSRFIGIAGE